MRRSPAVLHADARGSALGQFLYPPLDCRGVLLIMATVVQKVIQQLREEYPASSIDGDAEDAGAGAR